VQITDFFNANTKIVNRINRHEYDIVRQMNDRSLENCCLKSNMRNSVLERLRERKLEDIQLDTLAMVFSR